MHVEKHGPKEKWQTKDQPRQRAVSIVRFQVARLPNATGPGPARVERYPVRTTMDRALSPSQALGQQVFGGIKRRQKGLGFVNSVCNDASAPTFGSSRPKNRGRIYRTLDAEASNLSGAKRQANG